MDLLKSVLAPVDLSLMGGLEKVRFTLIMVVFCYVIWSSRNLNIFKKQVEVGAMIRFLESQVEEFETILLQDCLTTAVILTLQLWKPPPVMINTDTKSRSSRMRNHAARIAN